MIKLLFMPTFKKNNGQLHCFPSLRPGVPGISGGNRCAFVSSQARTARKRTRASPPDSGLVNVPRATKQTPPPARGAGADIHLLRSHLWLRRGLDEGGGGLTETFFRATHGESTSACILDERTSTNNVSWIVTVARISSGFTTSVAPLGNFLSPGHNKK